MTDTICVIATVRSPVNELMEFVRYHLAAGVGGIVLFFDDPDDTAADAVAGHPAVVPIRCNAAYWHTRRVDRPTAIEERQTVNVNFGMTVARSHGFDWIAHIDSDELLFAHNGIGTVLTGCSANVVRFAMKEAVAEQDYYASRFAATLFREQLTAAGRKQLAALPAPALEEILFEGEYFRGHSASKVAVRLDSNIQLMGIHGPQRPKRMPELRTEQIALLHYDCIGIDDWKRKWSRRLDASGTATEMRAARSKQLELFKQAYGNEASERALYARLHKVSEQQKHLLVSLGLLTVVSLDLAMRQPAE